MSPERLFTMSHDTCFPLAAIGVSASLWQALEIAVALVLVFVAIQAWRWVGQVGREHRDSETVRGVQEPRTIS